ncbi:thioredoxin domain-containing protein [Helicobacter bizzozeronii]|uniref:hypothetical protein n=1 Tax=Helicobacter bizzozeronii TaxID=56877 RepID=UPI000CF042E1|nr:hypothetical protein [Helicobacter bizzozeronii]
MHPHIVFNTKRINARFRNLARFARHYGVPYTALLHRVRNPYYTRLNHAGIYLKMQDDGYITINDVRVGA